MREILSVKGMSKSFNDGKILVLDDVSLAINKGDFLSVVGASGSGKSTLLTILGGIDRPTKGQVFLNGRDITALKEREKAKLRRTQIGFVFQFFNLAPNLTAMENIMLPIILSGRKPKDYREKAEWLTDYLKISAQRDKLPSKLSGGEQQRVAIARGLVFDPEILLLDEPTGNLDSATSMEIMQLLKNLNTNHNATIVQVTHSTDGAQFGNRIITILDGKIISEGVANGTDSKAHP